MKNIYSIATALLVAGAGNAYAKNSTVEDALKNREDLSMFYQAMVNSGVMDQLESGTSYTVFAPTNEAFAKIPQDRYPCFYSPECKAEVADIVRNHIVEGNYSLRDVARRGLPNLDHKFINVSEPTRDDFYVGGKHVETTHTLFGGMLYEIDGVIADDLEMIRVEAPRAAAPAAEIVYVAPEENRAVETAPLTPSPAR